MATDLIAIAESVAQIHQLMSELTKKVGTLAEQLAEHAVNSASPPSCDLASGTLSRGDTETRDRLSADVIGIIGDDYPGLHAALTGIGVIACCRPGLGQIHPAGGVQWLRRFGPGDFDAWWHKLCDLLRRFADEERPWQDRQDALVMLDMNLRTVVPAEFPSAPGIRAVPRILPPARNEEWTLLLEGCLAELRAFGEKNQFRVAHSLTGITVHESEQWHHVDNNQSLRQPVPSGSEDAHRVLWPLRAWSGRVEIDPQTDKEKLLSIDKARVVYGQPLPDPPATASGPGGADPGLA